MSRLEFHAEWLRDEPRDATATESRSYIAIAGANSRPVTGTMRFGYANRLAFKSSVFPEPLFLPGKGVLSFTGYFSPGSSHSRRKKLLHDEYLPAPLPRVRQDF